MTQMHSPTNYNTISSPVQDGQGHANNDNAGCIPCCPVSLQEQCSIFCPCSPCMNTGATEPASYSQVTNCETADWCCLPLYITAFIVTLPFCICNIISRCCKKDTIYPTTYSSPTTDTPPDTPTPPDDTQSITVEL